MTEETKTKWTAENVPLLSEITLIPEAYSKLGISPTTKLIVNAKNVKGDRLSFWHYSESKIWDDNRWIGYGTCDSCYYSDILTCTPPAEKVVKKLSKEQFIDLLKPCSIFMLDETWDKLYAGYCSLTSIPIKNAQSWAD